MATRSQLDKLSSRIEALGASLGMGRTAYVSLWGDETEAEALERHFRAHPEDRVGASYQFTCIRWMTREEAKANGWT
jgi:hypothetical protein